jgi:hypothetical protein
MEFVRDIEIGGGPECCIYASILASVSIRETRRVFMTNSKQHRQYGKYTFVQ